MQYGPAMGEIPLHRRIRDERIRAGLEPSHCARAMDWHHSRWQRMETGERPIRAEDMPRIARILGCTVARLYGEQAFVVPGKMKRGRKPKATTKGGSGGLVR